MPNRRAVLVRCAAQFNHQHGSPERAVGHLLTHINVGAADTACATTSKIELGPTILFVLEITRTVIVGCGVDCRAKIHCRLPVEIVMCVLTIRHPEIYSAETARTLALKEQQMPV